MILALTLGVVMMTPLKMAGVISADLTNATRWLVSEFGFHGYALIVLLAIAALMPSLGLIVTVALIHQGVDDSRIEFHEFGLIYSPGSGLEGRIPWAHVVGCERWFDSVDVLIIEPPLEITRGKRPRGIRGKTYKIRYLPISNIAPNWRRGKIVRILWAYRPSMFWSEEERQAGLSLPPIVDQCFAAPTRERQPPVRHWRTIRQ